MLSNQSSIRALVLSGICKLQAGAVFRNEGRRAAAGAGSGPPISAASAARRFGEAGAGRDRDAAQNRLGCQ